jgi:hypothetical protein
VTEIANRLELFIEHCGVVAVAECLLALLEMGVSHNRWYVERKCVVFSGAKLGEKHAKRLAIEFRADAEHICRRVRALEASIGVKRTVLHPILLKTLNEICK